MSNKPKNTIKNILDEISKHVTDKPVKSKLYLRLFHGRDDPNEDLDDWGYEGELIGPLVSCHITYLQTIKLTFENGFQTGPLFKRDGFGIENDLLFYNGSYYGDWVLEIA